WTLPAARSKNKRPRVTPLVGIARRIIEARLSSVEGGPLFTAETGTPLTAAHLGHYLLVRHNRLPIAKFTTHDLRRTVATMLTEMGIALDLVAAVVGHEAVGRETRTLVRHYVRTDLVERKRTVLEAWSHRLGEMIEGTMAPGNVAHLENIMAFRSVASSSKQTGLLQCPRPARTKAILASRTSQYTQERHTHHPKPAKSN